MDTFENIPQLWIVIILVISGVLLAVYFVMQRMLTSTDLATYVIVDDHGFKKVLAKGHHFIWRPGEKIFKGATAATLKYRLYDHSNPDTKESQNLLTRSSGRINLKIQQLICPEFLVSTSEHKEKRLHAQISFQLDRDILENALMYEDFGGTMQARIEEAFRELICQYGDEALGLKKAEIIRKVTEYLNEPEQEARRKKELPVTSTKPLENRADRTPLGVRFIDVGYYLPSDKKHTPPTETFKVGEGVYIRHMEDIDQERLDTIRDQFLMDDWSDSELVHDKEAHYQRANNIMLRILELQSSQNSTRALINSGSLMLLSPSDIGLNSYLMREPVRQEVLDLLKRKGNSHDD